MQYNFYKNDVFMNSVEAKSIKEAEEKLNMKISEELGTSFTTGEVVDEPQAITMLPEKKIRKPRADKGTPRKTKEISTVPKEKSRNKPEYFVFNGVLSSALTHDKALSFVSQQVDSKDIRIIMGHEIKYSHKVQFHK